MGPHSGLSLRGGTGYPSPHWNLEGLVMFFCLKLMSCVVGSELSSESLLMVHCVVSVLLPLLRYVTTDIDSSDEVCVIVIVIATTMFMSSWHCHCESSPGSSDECSTQRQVAADLWTKPISLSQ